VFEWTKAMAMLILLKRKLVKAGLRCAKVKENYCNNCVIIGEKSQSPSVLTCRMTRRREEGRRRAFLGGKVQRMLADDVIASQARNQSCVSFFTLIDSGMLDVGIWK
jgi:hypothetical protein